MHLDENETTGGAPRHRKWSVVSKGVARVGGSGWAEMEDVGWGGEVCVCKEHCFE